MSKAFYAAALLCLAATFSSYSQKSPITFADIPLEALKMKVYPNDSSAAAVLLVDYGEAYLNLNMTTVTTNFAPHVRVKTLNKEGLEWADAAIQLYKSG